MLKDFKKIGYCFLTTTLLILGISSKTNSQNTTPGLCLRHTRISGSSGNVVDTNWVCSRAGDFSKWIGLGDDTGWKDQELAFKVIGDAKICFEHTRVSPASGLLRNSKCSRSSNDIQSVSLGDDTGWKEQKLSFTIYTPRENYEICLQHRRRSGSTGKVINTGWKCASEWDRETIYLGDDTGWRDQNLRFTIRNR
ncbi:MAG: hypothetical protein F6K41_39295 [Symploca sp. SIO3E6]|nr:hypothetical protein [Caldora sp. SIO3E6]